MWGLLIYAGVFIVSRTLEWLLEPNSRSAPPQPQRFDMARVQEATPVPIGYGCYRIDSPLIVMHHNHDSRQTQTGFAYGLDMLFVLGMPTRRIIGALSPQSRLRKVYWGDHVIDTGSSTTHLETFTTAPIEQQLFGGENFGGGLAARFTFFDGRPSQVFAATGTAVANRLATAGIDATLIPNYRYQQLVYVEASSNAFAAGVGESPRLPQIGFEIDNSEGHGTGNLAFDDNPAWVLYDLIVGEPWKLGYSVDDVDKPSFQAAADILYAESHGYSNVFMQGDDARNILQEVIDQIDAVLFEDPSTGLVTLKLIRDDVDPGDILEMTLDNTLERPQLQVNGRVDTINEVIVSFPDRTKNYKPNSRRAQKLANIAGGINNRRRSITIDYRGCTNGALAEKLAARNLYQMGRPVVMGQVKLNHDFFATKPGDVVRANWPRPTGNGLVGMLFRVIAVDLGQLADSAITLHVVEDIFGNTDGAFPPPPSPTDVFTLPPLTERVLDEAPYFLTYQLHNHGGLPNLTDQRLLACAANELDSPADTFRELSKSGGTTGTFVFSTLGDIGPQKFPTTATVATSYPATLAPYDTTVGLVVEDVTGRLAATFATLAATPTEIRVSAANLALVGRELIAFEGVTDLGGGQYQLVNVRRELLDTVPADHPVGERLYLIGTDAVGRRPWPIGTYARGFAIPSKNSTIGSDGFNASDDILVAGRMSRSLRAADVVIQGYDLDGTRGSNLVQPTYPLLGDFKAATRLEAGIDIAGRPRALAHGLVVFGEDTTSYPAETGTTWDVYAQKVGEDEVAITGKTGLTTPSATGVLFGEAGHGPMDIVLHTVNGGARSWQSPAIRVEAPTWRDLLDNGSFDRGTLASWTAIAGTTTIASGTDSLPRFVSNRWLRAATAVADITKIRQVVDVSGYLPIGLTATVVWYTRNFSADALDWSRVTVRALDANDVQLATATSSDIVGPLTHWRRAEQTLALPAGTAKISVDVSIVNSGGAGGSTAGNSGVTRIQLQVGQVSAELLTNPSFDGNLTSWTNVTNSFVVNSGNPYSSRNGTIGSAQGGAFSSSEIKQTPAVPAGYEYGVALLTFARSTTIDLDTGEVVLEALNGGGSVITSVTTGAEYALVQGVAILDVWDRRRLALQLPDGTASIRIRLLAVRTAGSGNSGACFDDFSLRIHKDLDPVTTYDFDFGEPVWQPVPSTWGRFHIDYPALPMPVMVWGGELDAPSIQPTYRLDGPTHGWSDGLTHDAAKFVGLWDIGPHALFYDPELAHVPVTEAYRFVREIAADAIDLQTTGRDAAGEEYGDFAVDEPFTLAVLFKVEELSFTTACGVAGRRDNSGHGFGLRIDATGHLQAVMQGASGTATATASGTVHDRAPHWGVLVHDAGATTLRLYDDHGGSATASTASIGALTATGGILRIGRDGPASASGGLAIARAYLFDEALSADDVAALMRYGTDPTPSGLLTLPDGEWIADAAVYVPGPDDVEGTTLLRYSTHHVPVGYSAALDADGDGYGAVTNAGNTNLLTSADFRHPMWQVEGGAILTHDIVDPTGLAHGARVTIDANDQWLIGREIPLVGVLPVSLTFWARTVDSVVSHELGVVLLDETMLIDLANVTITPLWQRFDVTFTGWSDSTPTAGILFGMADFGSFDLAHVMLMSFGEDPPVAVQDAGLAVGLAYGIRNETLPLQLQNEGEILVEGAMLIASPDAGFTFASIDNGGADTNDERALVTRSSARPRFTLYDDVGSPTNVDGDAIDWSEPWVLRGRWNLLELTEAIGDQLGIVVDGSADSTTTSALVFAGSGTPHEGIHIGGGDVDGSLSPNAIIRRVIVRTREPKIGG